CLRDLRVGGAGGRRLLRVGVDAPGALRDLGDAERDELLRLARDRAVLERLLIELEKRAIHVGNELPHLLELRLDVDVVELHNCLLAAAEIGRRGAAPTSGRRTPWRRRPGSGAWSPPTARGDRRSASARRGRSHRGA